MFGRADSDTLLGHWELDRVAAEKRIESYTQDEDIAFLLYMIVDSMEEIKFSGDGGCKMLADKDSLKREKCWEENGSSYTLYGYSGNEVGEIEVLDTNHIAIGLSDEAFPKVLALNFNRVPVQSKKDTKSESNEIRNGTLLEFFR